MEKEQCDICKKCITCLSNFQVIREGSKAVRNSCHAADGEEFMIEEVTGEAYKAFYINGKANYEYMNIHTK